MTIFTVLMPSPQPNLVTKIKAEFPSDHYQLSDTQFLISTVGTAVELTTKLGIYDPKNTDMTPTGIAVIFSTSSYFGRGPTVLWEWLKQKLEAAPHG